jgi:hypothetical protein
MNWWKRFIAYATTPTAHISKLGWEPQYEPGRVVYCQTGYAKKARARDIAALVRQLREMAADDEHRYSRAGRLCHEAADALVDAFLNADATAKD